MSADGTSDATGNRTPTSGETVRYPDRWTMAPASDGFARKRDGPSCRAAPHLRESRSRNEAGAGHPAALFSREPSRELSTRVFKQSGHSTGTPGDSGETESAPPPRGEAGRRVLQRQVLRGYLPPQRTSSRVPCLILPVIAAGDRPRDA